ncbi:hypothetical protein DFH09DRAFT_1316301 [Mycena vulgaris]|nr:hypothetical protein DFH09DRAFT_1316301 [Mycena vulgaris]
MEAPDNGTQIAENVDLSLGFVDVDLNFPPGSYRIVAADNDTAHSTSFTLQTTGDFPLIDPAPNDPISTTPASTPASTTVSPPPASSAPPSPLPATPPPDNPPSTSSPNASPSSSASATASSTASSTASLPASLLASFPGSAPSSTGTSSQNSGTTVTGETALPSNSAVAAKSQPSTGVIVAVVICVLVILAGLIFLCLFLRRRKQRRRDSRSRDTLESPPQMAPSSLTMTTGTYPNSHIEPFTSPISASTSLSSPQQRQQHITNEMRLVRKRMEELRHTTNSTSASSSAPESSVSSPSQTSAPSTSADATSADATSADATSADATSAAATSADLDRSRQQNDELQAQITQLEAQLQSTWALGLSNDPPPGYVA